MSRTSNTTTRARLHISARIIFSSRELKQYRRWQRLYTTLEPAEHGYVPTASEFEDFQQWLKKQDSGYFSDIFEDVSNHVKSIKLDPTVSMSEPPVAYLCRHHMHPSTAGRLEPRCPVCTIDVHLNYMNVLTRILQEAGGRAPSCTLQASEHQENVYQVWSSEKLSTVQQLSNLERLAEQEAEWSARHPEPKYEDMKTAKQALELYWSEMGSCQDTKSPKKKETKVSFTEETRDSPGRPQEYYWRRSPRYEPGKYASRNSNEEEIAFTSRHIFGQQIEEEIVSEDSEDYSQVPVPILPELAAGESETRHLVQEVEERPRDDESFDEMQEDDGDSDWEDVESDKEDFGGRDIDDQQYVLLEDVDESNFIVFAED